MKHRNTRHLITLIAGCTVPAVAFAHADDHSVADNALADPSEIVVYTLKKRRRQPMRPIYRQVLAR